MQLHLDEISRHVAEGAHAALLLDRAGWHITAKLDMPNNITPIFLPSRAPELDRSKTSRNFCARTGSQIKHRVQTLGRNHRRCLRRLAQAHRPTDTITSIGMRDWAHVGQPL